MTNSFKYLSLALRPLSETGKAQYAILTLKNEPVNALNLAVWADLLEALKAVESMSNVRGLIISSGIKKDIFTAGNDLRQLYAPATNQDEYYKFWITQTQFLTRLYRSRLVTLAAIRGHCPAGGCGLSLCCDYRIMTSSSSTPSARIGLNEPSIGILVPKYWAQLFMKTVGSAGEAEHLLQFGQMVKPEEALKLGLVHEIISTKDLLKISEERMKMLLEIPDAGRQLTKSLMRDDFGKEWEAYGDYEAKMGWKALNDPKIIKALADTLQSISQRKL